MNKKSGAIVALLLISAVVVFVTWPQARFISTKVGGHVDSLFSVWRLAWIADSVASAPTQVFNAPIFYPHKNTLAYSDSILLSGVLTAPLRWLGVGPFVVYNLYLLAAIIASGFAAALLCHQLTRNWFAAAVGGAIFTVSPHRMEHFERLELLTSFAIPIAFYCWHAGTSGRSKRWVALAVFCVAIQWFLGMYQALFLATVMPVLVVDWWRQDKTMKSVAIQGAAIGMLLSVALIVPFTIPYLRARQDVGERSATEVADYSAQPKDFVAVHPRNWLYGEALSPYGAPERHLFPGMTATVLATAGFVLAEPKTRLLYGIVLLVGFDLTLGSNGVLFPLLREAALPYRALRAPARAMIIMLLPLAVFASVAVARWLSGMRSTVAALACVALMALLGMEYRMRPDLWDVPDQGKLVPWAAPAGAVLLEYPLARADRLYLNLDAHYMVARVGEWPRMLNGYSGHYPRDYIRLLEDTTDFPSHDAIEAIARHGATHIAVHEAFLEGRYQELMESVLARPALEIVGRYRESGGEVMIFRIRSMS